MVCDCCGKKKKLFESFAAIKIDSGNLNLCVECNDLAYKIRDDANEKNKELFDKHLQEWNKRAEKALKRFEEWKKGFVKKQESMFEDKKKLEPDSEDN